MARPREEWLQDCGARYRALEQFSQEDARLQFLRILRSLPYGQYYRNVLTISNDEISFFHICLSDSLHFDYKVKLCCRCHTLRFARILSF